MRTTKTQNPMDQIDAVADHGDKIAVEIQQRADGYNLYVHCNGITVLRVGKIDSPIEVTQTGAEH